MGITNTIALICLKLILSSQTLCQEKRPSKNLIEV